MVNVSDVVFILILDMDLMSHMAVCFILFKLGNPILGNHNKPNRGCHLRNFKQFRNCQFTVLRSQTALIVGRSILFSSQVGKWKTQNRVIMAS